MSISGSSRKRQSASRRIRLEQLESRRLLAVANSEEYYFHPQAAYGDSAPGVLRNDTYGAGATLVLEPGGVNSGDLTFNTTTGAWGYVLDPGIQTPLSDFFNYHLVEDGHASNTAMVGINIGNAPPIANGANYNGSSPQFPYAEKGTPFTFDLVSNATDKEHDTLTVSKINGVAYAGGSVRLNHGYLAVTPLGTYTYTPDPGFEGSDSFQYRVKDDYAPNRLESSEATISITVGPIAHADVEPPIIREGEEFDLDGSGSVGNIQQYIWYVDLNPTPGPQDPAPGQQVLTGQNPHVTWPMLNGLGISTHTTPGVPALITLKIVDAAGKVSYDQDELDIQEVDPQFNDPLTGDPTASFSPASFSPVSVVGCGSGNVVQLDAVFFDANPFDTDFTVGIDWNWDSITEPSGPVPDPNTHLTFEPLVGGGFRVVAVGGGPITYDYGAAAGTFTPALVVTETDGDQGVFVQTITVGQVNSEIDVSAPAGGDAYMWFVLDSEENLLELDPEDTSGQVLHFTPDTVGTYTAIVRISIGKDFLPFQYTVIATAVGSGGGEFTAAITSDPDDATEGSLISLDPGLAGGCGGDPELSWTVTRGTEIYTGSGSTFDFTPQDSGPYAVTLQVNNASVTGGTATINIGNVAPIAALGNSGPVNEGGSALVSFGDQFDPSSADTSAGLHYSIALASGDLAGSYAAASDGTSKPFSFADDGSYTVYGRILDKDGAFNDYSTTVTVRNVTPTLTISGDTIVNEGSSYTLNLSSSDPGADTISRWTINWGDSTQVVSGNPSSVTHIYADGTPTSSYIISATATDEDGTFVAGNTVAVTVNNLVPVVAPISGPTAGVRFQTLTYTSSFSDVAADADASTVWTVLDSASAIVASGSGTSFDFVPTTVGTYTVKFTVDDHDGGVVAVSTAPVIISATQVQGGVLYVGGTASNDTFNFKQTGASQYSLVLNGVNQGNFSPTGAVQIYGGDGSDAITINGDADPNVFAVQAGSVVLNGLPFNDHQIESRTINAHGNDDTITVVGGSAIVNGDAGSDTLIAATGVTNTWSLSAPHAGSLVYSDGQIDFASIETLVGDSSAADTLIGRDANSVWTLTGANSGTVGNLAFAGFDSLQGGSANDTFRVTQGVSSGVSIAGGGGTDKLDYSAYTIGVHVDLLAGTADGIAGVSQIENVAGGDGNDVISGDANDNVITGGAGNDILRGGDGRDTLSGGAGSDILFGGAGDDTLNGGAGRDILIGGTGADHIFGNADEDILIAGTTDYDNDLTNAALIAILNEWNVAGSGTAWYNARRTNIMNGRGTLTGTGYHLFGDNTGPQSQTVHNDNDIDTLNGDGGTDWFFANQAADANEQAIDVTDRTGTEVWNDTDT